MANNNTPTFADKFFVENLKKGYSEKVLSEMLRKKGVDESIIRKASKNNPSRLYEQEAVSYIAGLVKSNMKKGISTQEISSSMQENGISSAVIKKAIQSVSAQAKAQGQGPPLILPIQPPMPLISDVLRKIPSLPKSEVLKKLAYITGTILITLSLIYYFLPEEAGVAECGTDKNCFVTYASICRPARVSDQITGSMLVYETYEDCSLSKRFADFNPSEPAEVTDFFRGKTMLCKYPREMFPLSLTDNLVSGIDQCQGTLKDAIYELEYARQQLQEID